MKFNFDWLKILAKIGPTVLLFTPLAPIAPVITMAIHIAEELGKMNALTGPEKKTLALEISRVSTNVLSNFGKVVKINSDALESMLDNGIDAVVSATNLVHKEAESVASPAAEIPVAVVAIPVKD